MFGSTSAFSTTASTNTNAMKDVEVWLYIYTKASNEVT